jgi:lipid-binding SYLF domain-containing protein
MYEDSYDLGFVNMNGGAEKKQIGHELTSEIAILKESYMFQKLKWGHLFTFVF